MTGFEAIAHHNGWVMAGLGAAIVFAGLAVLSFVISQLPRLFSLFEKKSSENVAEIVTEKEVPAKQPKPASGTDHYRDPARLAEAVEPLAATLDQPFQLSDLYRLCRDNDLPHPHLSLSRLQREGYLISQGEGAFTWKSEQTIEQEG